MNLEINGRGLKQGIVSVNPSAAGLVIRADDNGNPEFWVEVRLPLARLRELLQTCEQMKFIADAEAATGET